MSFSMTSAMSWRGAAILAAVEETEHLGLELALEHLLQTSQRLVPLRSGKLQATGEVLIDGEDKNKGSVSYGTPYAVAQHERLDFHHPNGRQAKYLEQPMLSEAGVMFGKIHEKMRF